MEAESANTPQNVKHLMARRRRNPPRRSRRPRRRAPEMIRCIRAFSFIAPSTWSQNAAFMGVPPGRNYRPLSATVRAIASQFPAVLQIRLMRFDSYDCWNSPPVIVGVGRSVRVHYTYPDRLWWNETTSNPVIAIDAICMDKSLKATIFVEVAIVFRLSSRQMSSICPTLHGLTLEPFVYVQPDQPDQELDAPGPSGLQNMRLD